jgi:hypothetical protein
MMEQRKCIMGLITAVLIMVCSASFMQENAFASGFTGNVPPVPIDHKFKPRLGTYNYKVEFNSIGIGIASVAVGLDGDLYKMQILAETIGVVDRIYRIRYRGEAITDTDSISPVETKIHQTVKSKEKDLTMLFQDNGTIKTKERKSENGGPAQYDEWKLQTEKFTLDPFSAAYLVRVLDWEAGRAQVFDLYTGKGQYELRLKCDSGSTIDFGGVKRKVWVIIPDLKKMDDNNRPVEMKKKPSSVKIYISADEYKDILKMEASHTLGYFRVVLDSFEPAEAPVKDVALPGKAALNPAKEVAVQNRAEETQNKDVVSRKEEETSRNR